MKLLTIVAAIAAGAALYLKRRSEKQAVQDEDNAELLTYESDDDSSDEMQHEELAASVLEASRAMDPLTLQGASRVTFDCEDGKKRKLLIPGPNGVFLTKGDKGLLTFAGSAFISFEKDDGEFVSPLFHTLPDGREA